jgi:hypothetical protein
MAYSKAQLKSSGDKRETAVQSLKKAFLQVGHQSHQKG